MKHLRLSLGLTLGLAGIGAFVGCAAGTTDSTGGAGGATSSTSTSSASGSTTSSTTNGSSSSGFMTGTGGGPPALAEVFFHSPDTLYELDPISKQVTTIGKFTGCEVTADFSKTGIMDMALDKDSTIYVTSHLGLYTVKKEDASCTKIAAGDYPNSLSFVPAGTLDPNEEALVGYVVEPNPINKNQYVQINTTDGKITKIGNVWTESVVSSGDIVSVKNGPTYLTLKGGDNNECSPNDCLAEVNPQTGKLIKNYGQIGTYSKIFGFAFWGGSSYGFTSGGQLFELKIQGNALITTPVSTAGGLVFWGAGSSTLAPVVPQ
ncbi:MAG: hypothetical protein U0414_29820 [Polyangiaceae bacterium]